MLGRLKFDKKLEKSTRDTTKGDYRYAKGQYRVAKGENRFSTSRLRYDYKDMDEVWKR